jgi:hypothetical protein
MRNVTRFAAIVFLCLALAGCYETFPPIQSGNVTHWQGGRPQGSAQQLTPEQVANLSVWLQEHRWGWQPVIATYAPAIIIYVVHSDGTKTSANLMQQVLIVGQHQRSISEAERQELLSVIGAKNGR